MHSLKDIGRCKNRSTHFGGQVIIQLLKARDIRPRLSRLPEALAAKRNILVGRLNYLGNFDRFCIDETMGDLAQESLGLSAAFLWNSMAFGNRQGKISVSLIVACT